MKAAVVREYQKPLSLEEVARPAPKADEVLIKVQACGVCHSDLHLAESDWPQLGRILKRPLILGHEVVGSVIEKGSQVIEPALGTRVGISWIHWTCGECELCKEGRENLCQAQIITGATVDGGYAEFVCAKASHVARVPDNLTSQEAAPFLCAGVTVYRALKNVGIQPGQRVAIFGVGGLGHLAIQIAKMAGAYVFAIDITETKLTLARKLGADKTLNATTSDAIAAVRAVKGVHVAMVTSAAKPAYDMAFGSLRRGGTLIVVGVPKEPLTLPAINMVGGEFRILASSVGTRADVREVLDLAAAGKVRCQTQSRPLDEINEVFDDMRRGSIDGRVVLTFS